MLMQSERQRLLRRHRIGALLLFCAVLLASPGRAAAQDVMVIGGLVAPPYIIKDEHNNPSGILVELIQQTLRPLGIEPQFRITNWARAFKSATAGKIDALIPAIKSPDREKALIYPAEPLTVLQMGLMRQKGSSAVYDGELESLKGRRIGRIRNARVAPAFDKAAANGLFHLEERSSFGLLALAVVHGRVDFLAGDELMGLWGAAENGVLNRIEVAHPHFGDNPVYLAISKKSPLASRAAEISVKLAEIKKSQNFKQALEAYGRFLQKDVFEYLLKASAD